MVIYFYFLGIGCPVDGGRGKDERRGVKRDWGREEGGGRGDEVMRGGGGGA
jgi:hypothetical protein